jgi:L-alanine-DL-glutamate epimerase-like enolase superfamily enzyme
MNRRFPLESDLELMKITDVRTTLLTGPSTNDPFLREARKFRSAAFIEVFTDGSTGLGETYAGYFCPEIVPPIVDFFRPILIGQTVEDIPALWQRMYHCGNFWCRVGLGASVLTSIEAALWDLKGKLSGLTVYQLLGGTKHERLPCYATGGPSNYPKDRLAQKIDHYLNLGFRGFKVATGSFSPEQGWFLPSTASEASDFEADKLTFIRSHAGPDVRVMLDGHMGNSVGATWSLEVATAVARALEPYNLFFFEEPLHYTDPWSYAELCRATSVPIAGGECLTAAYEWRVFAEEDAFDIGQPDASFTGGLTEFLKVAHMLDARGRGIATHAWGAAGSLMQNVHCGFAAPNTKILEVPPDFAGLHTDLLDGAFVMKDGYVLPPDRPGLGIVLTDAIRRRYPFVPGSGEYNSVPGKMLKD